MYRKKHFYLIITTLVMCFIIITQPLLNLNGISVLANTQKKLISINSKPKDFMSNEIPEIKKKYRNYLEKIKSKNDVPNIVLNIYRNATKSQFRKSYKKHGQEDKYNGILITYFKGEIIITSSFSNKLSNEKLFRIRDQVIEEMEAGESDREFLTELLKRIAAASAGKSFTPDSMAIYVEDNLGEITDGRFKLYCGDEEFILDIDSKEKLKDNYRLNFRLSPEKISKIEAAGCEIE